MKATLLILALALAALPAGASCVQCPNPPCEIQACPPEDLPIFATMGINGVDTGIGEAVEVEDDYFISVTDIDDAGDGEMEVEIGLQVPDGELFPRTISLVREVYVWSNNAWNLESTDDPEVLFTTAYNDYWTCGSAMVGCAYAGPGCHQDCMLTSWCEGLQLCIGAVGPCDPGTSTCVCSLENPPGCPGSTEITPTGRMRKLACAAGRRCKLTIVDISEG